MIFTCHKRDQIKDSFFLSKKRNLRNKKIKFEKSEVGETMMMMMM